MPRFLFAAHFCNRSTMHQLLLFLNSLGTGEVLLILFIVLILFGSKGIPDFVKNLGKGMRTIRSASDEIKRDIREATSKMREDLNVQQMIDSPEKKGTPPSKKDVTSPADASSGSSSKTDGAE